MSKNMIVDANGVKYVVNTSDCKKNEANILSMKNTIDKSEVDLEKVNEKLSEVSNEIETINETIGALGGGAGSGAGGEIVTFKITGTESAPVPDKTFAELKEAYESGKIVKVLYNSYECHLVRTWADAYEFICFKSGSYGGMLFDDLYIHWFMWMADKFPFKTTKITATTV